MILRYSSSPSTALYIAAKSIAGTVRVPSMSKTTPLRRTLEAVIEGMVEKEAMGNGGLEGRNKEKKALERSNGMDKHQRLRDIYRVRWRTKAGP